MMKTIYQLSDLKIEPTYDNGYQGQVTECVDCLVTEHTVQLTSETNNRIIISKDEFINFAKSILL